MKVSVWRQMPRENIILTSTCKYIIYIYNERDISSREFFIALPKYEHAVACWIAFRRRAYSRTVVYWRLWHQPVLTFSFPRKKRKARARPSRKQTRSSSSGLLQLASGQQKENHRYSCDLRTNCTLYEEFFLNYNSYFILFYFYLACFSSRFWCEPYP